MKKIQTSFPILFLTLTVLIFSSCSSLKVNDFTARKYTNFNNRQAKVNLAKPQSELYAAAHVQYLSRKDVLLAEQVEKGNIQKQSISTFEKKLAKGKVRRLAKAHVKNTFPTAKLIQHTKKKDAFVKSAAPSDDSQFWLEVILAIILPPLGVYIHEKEIGNKFWISLILTLLLFLPGIIYSLLVVTDII